MLYEVGQGEHIDIQLAKIALLGEQDKLVIRRDIQQCWKANISSFKNEDGRSLFSSVWTSLPLFYLYDKTLLAPQVVFSRKYKKHKFGPRADKKSENKPFVTSIHAYRYKKIDN